MKRIIDSIGTGPSAADVHAIIDGSGAGGDGWRRKLKAAALVLLALPVLVLAVLALSGCKIHIPQCVVDGSCLPQPRATATSTEAPRATATPAPTSAPVATVAPTTAPSAEPTSATPNPNRAVVIAFFGNGPKGGGLLGCGDGTAPCYCGPGGNAGCNFPSGQRKRAIMWDATVKICLTPDCGAQVPCDPQHPLWYDGACNHRDYDTENGPTVYTTSTGEMTRVGGGGGYERWVECTAVTTVTTCTSVPHVTTDGKSWPVSGDGCKTVSVSIPGC